MQYHPSIVAPLPSPTDDSWLIIQAAQKGLQAIYRKGFLFMKAGVMLLDLRTKYTDSQFDLFEDINNIEQKQKSDKLMQTLDAINQKMGKHMVQLGGVRKQAPWQIKREQLSPRYTTRWDELLEVQ